MEILRKEDLRLALRLLTMKKSKITATELARSYGIEGKPSNQTKVGKRMVESPRPEEIPKMAKILGVSVDFLTGENLLIEGYENRKARTIISSVSGDVQTGGGNTMYKGNQSEFEKILDIQDPTIRDQAMQYFLNNK